MGLDDLFDKMDVVYEYTTQQALEDGILFDITKLNKDWEKGPFNYVTMNLLAQGYFNYDKKDGDPSFNYANIVDLLIQSQQIMKTKSHNFTKLDWFYDGEIELPSGQKQNIFMVQNETRKYTLMLPQDY